MTNRQIKVKTLEKKDFYKMRAGERETEMKCGRITRDAGDFLFMHFYAGDLTGLQTVSRQIIIVGKEEI